MCFAILASQTFQCDTVLWKTFEGENFREFQDFAAIREIFLFEIWGSGIFLWYQQETHESFPL